MLEGIKVLDLSRALAGPYCTMLLGDMGADVIKIERPGKGDDSRAWGPPFIEGESAYFLSINRNKKSITLNLKSEKGKEILFKLIKISDVLIETNRPGVMEKLGLSFEEVKNVNPKIVYCSISGFGQTGPYKLRPGFDQVIQGMGGLMSITGEENRPPIKVGVAITDVGAGMYAAIGILAALLRRDKTGKGEYIDVSMLDGTISWLTYQSGRYFASGEVPKPMGSGHPLIVPYQAFKTKDIYINIAVGNDSLWRKFCETIGLNIADDPKFSTNAKRVENKEELIKILNEILSKKTGKEWLEILNKAGIPCGPIYKLNDIFSDRHVLSREMVSEIEHPKAGKIKLTGVPIKFKNSPGKIRLHPPLLGENNFEILEEIGYKKEEIEKFREEGVI
ncbi:CoA transferase [Thermococci archaeon]|nr:MAG: CoA transferase [Thermococci archaeon]